MLFRTCESVCLLVACVIAGIVCDSQQACGEDPPIQLTHDSEWEARIVDALDGMSEWEFQEVPLQEVCTAIQDKLGIDVVLDVKALEDNGIDQRTPITRSVSGISNRSFLRLMLGELDLTYTRRLGALWITTHEAAEAQLVTQVYPVGDLLVGDSTSGAVAGSHDLLIGAITSNIAPDSWDEVGGPGAIKPIQDSLVVSQTFDMQKQVEQFFATYREIIASETGADEPEQTVFMLEAEANSAIRAALDKPLTADFQEQSLKEVVESLVDETGIPIVIDVRALEDFGIDTATPITQQFTNTTLRFALRRLLHPLELTYTIRDEVLVITTPEEAEAHLEIGLYPVRDLVLVGDDSWLEPLGARCDFDTLTNLIQSVIHPDSWDVVGGPSSIGALLPVPTIVIAQTQDIHEEIAELLAKLRAVKRLEAARKAPDAEVDAVALIVRSYPIYSALHSSDELAKLVMRASEPGTWDDQAGTFVQGLGPMLIVKHNAGGHRQVQKLLLQLGVQYPSGFKARPGKQPMGGMSPAAADAQSGTPGGMGGGGFF